MIGDLLSSRYRMDSVIGKGSFGTIYRAHDMLLERDVAVKVLVESDFDIEGLARILHEAQAAARLNHPNIVSVYDAGKGEGLAYIVMELVEGTNLHQSGPMSIRQVIQLACQLCQALEHAHSQGIVHRDVKPENVMVLYTSLLSSSPQDEKVEPGMKVKLMDFGLAHTRGSSRLLERGEIVGTLYYMAPEQATGQEVDGRADLYALGVMLYELLSGRLPFHADNPLDIINQHAHTPPVPPSQYNPEISPDLEAIVLKLLAKPPDERYWSAGETYKALANLGGAGVLEMDQPSGEPIQAYELLTEEGLESSGEVKASPHNLLLPLMPLVGREKELTELSSLLREPACRLVSLVGPGGCGKTRLAMEVATAQVENYPAGVFFVSLAPLQSAERIVPVIAQALSFSFRPSVTEPKQQLLDFLQGKKMLLILDNFEHLIPQGIPWVVELLERVESVNIMITSRERLHIQAEWLYPLDGLELPKSAQEEGVESRSAIQLFMQVARRQRNYPITEQELPDVVRICQSVGGMPLAINLAANWVRSLSCEEIVREISRDVRFLQTEARDLPVRQRSMWRVFEHSWWLLEQEEQVAFRNLAVFHGGFTRQAAEQVAGISLMTLMSLVNKSLLFRQPNGRYQLHELLRQFAAEKLAEVPDEKEAAQARHSEYYLTLLHARERALKDSRQRETLAEVDQEIFNIHTAWDWAVLHEWVDALDHALEGLYTYYSERVRFQEGESILNQTQELLPEGIPEIFQARLLARHGAFHQEIGPRKQARKMLVQSLALSRRLDLKPEIVFCLTNLGRLLSYEEIEEGISCLEESLAISREVGDPLMIAQTLFHLGGKIYLKGLDVTRSDSYTQESLALFRQLKMQRMVAYCLDRLGVMHALIGESGEAERYYQESLAAFTEIDEYHGMALAMGGLGLCAQIAGGDRLEEAREWLEKSLSICLDRGFKVEAGTRLTMLSSVLSDMGLYQEAAEYASQSLEIHTSFDFPGEKFMSLYWLSNTSCGLGDFRAARGYLREALTIGKESLSADWLLLGLYFWGNLLIREHPGPQRKRLALELDNLVLRHPALVGVRYHPLTSGKITRPDIEKAAKELESDLPPEIAAAARVCGQNLELEEVVSQIIAGKGDYSPAE